MAVYTCYEMIADCRANKREGWACFACHYLPIVRILERRYSLAAPLARVCDKDAPMFDKPVPEREFVARLRQHVMNYSAAGEEAVDMAPVTAALENFSAMERQAVWMATMRYDAASSAAILRMEPKTVEAVRDRALDALRGHFDSWSRGILEANGFAWGSAVAAPSGDACVPVRWFLDLLDGKMTWQRRTDIEFHLTTCWHCVDHLCRLREVDELLRHNQPASDDQVRADLAALGFSAEPEKKSLWKRLGL